MLAHVQVSRTRCTAVYFGPESAGTAKQLVAIRGTHIGKANHIIIIGT